ncbi:MAG: TRAP transporter substrate-binding protein [Paracoccus sp. (in: a-proteobacteria)]|nr:TRAP transporter substrate-binding protein [Paracoccus sp. (in: a-proteobacteria)]
MAYHNRLVAAALVAAMCSMSPAMAKTLRMAGNFPAEHSSSQAMDRFAEAVTEATGGALSIANFPAMQLGGAQENVDQVRSGVIFGTWIGAAYLSGSVPEVEAISLPFVYADREDAFRVIDGPVGDDLNRRLADQGFLPLGWMELGSRNVTNNIRPIETAGDMRGLKIRLQPNETHIATFRALGANPVSMGISEVYSALQQGVLDGHENPYSVIRSRNMNEVQKYVSDTNHFFDFIALVVNRSQFEALPEDQQQQVRQAAAEAVAWQRSTAAAEDEAAREALIAAGMTFTHVTDEARAEMQAATAPVIDQLRARIDPALIDRVLEDATQ